MNRRDHDRRLFQVQSANQRREESKAGQLGELTSQVRVIEGYYDLDTGKVE
jgi:hypothetical protein